jgi:hypothetical protein
MAHPLVALRPDGRDFPVSGSPESLICGSPEWLFCIPTFNAIDKL